MATAKPSGALSSVMALPAGSTEEEQKLAEVRQAQQALKEALDQRKGFYLDPTMLAIAQGFAAPTRTGNFFESLGNVAGNIGKVQEAEQQRAQEIARMRLELAAGELGMLQQQRTNQMFEDALRGGMPSGVPSGAQAGRAPAEGAPAEGAAAPRGVMPGETIASAVPSGTISPETIAIIRNRNPEKGKILEDLVKDRMSRFEVRDNVVWRKDAPGGPMPIMDLRTGEQKPTEIVVRGKSITLNLDPVESFQFRQAYGMGKGDEYFDKYLKDRTPVRPAAGGALQEIQVFIPGMPEPLNIRGTPRQAAEIERLTEEARRTRNPSMLMEYLRDMGQKVSVSGEPAAAQAAAAPAQPSKPAETPRPTEAQKAVEVTENDLGHLPYSEQIKITAERLTEADKPAQEQAKVIMTAASPNVLISSNNRLREIVKLVREEPKAVGLMMEQGLIPAVMSAAQQGIQVGPYRLSAPAEEFLKKLKLDPRQQGIARRITQLLDEEFFSRAQLYKGALGPQMSNADAVFMKSPLAQTTDPAGLIEYWSMYGLLNNRMMDDMYRGLNDWQNKAKGRQSVRNFFNNQGRKIMEDYSRYFNELEGTFAPRR